MKISPYDFETYKAYLGVRITQEAADDRSYRARLSEHIRCQQSYLSQVMNGAPDFTLEQAHRLNQFLHHDKAEAKYFLVLVEMARAGTKELREFFREQATEAKQARFHLKSRLKQTEEISPEAQHTYYSTWFYSAIYIILMIPKYQSIPAIANRFNLPEELVVKVLNFLEESGLVEVKGGKYLPTKKRIHLDRNSIFIQRHHINWRSQALQSVEKNLSDDMHFSTVVSLSLSDFEKVKEIFVQAIENAREIIRPSPEEEIVAITIDAFRL